MSAIELKTKISAWLNDKNNNENDLVDFLIDECGVVLEDEEEEEGCLTNCYAVGKEKCNCLMWTCCKEEEEEMEEEVVCECVNHNEENWRENCDLASKPTELEEKEDIVFCCKNCDKQIVRESEEHENSKCDNTGENWYCQDCHGWYGDVNGDCYCYKCDNHFSNDEVGGNDNTENEEWICSACYKDQ